MKFETLQIHAGQEQPDPATGARAVPIYQNAAYVFNDCDHAQARFGLTDPGNIYGRLTNPTQQAFEERMAALEGGSGALGVASGAAAIAYTLQNLAHAGDHIVSSKNIYGGTYNLLAHTLPDYGIETTFVDGVANSDSENDSVKDSDSANSNSGNSGVANGNSANGGGNDAGQTDWEAAIRPNTKAIFAETLGNPNSEIADIEKLADIAHRHGIPLVIDNTFATPYLVRPIEYGADIVVHSATKFIGGHGTAIGGVIIDGGKFDWAAGGRFDSMTKPDPSYHGISFSEAAGPAAFVTKIRAILLRDTGATMAPLHAFLFLQGLETLSLRVERHVSNALKVIDFLGKQPKVEKIEHPSITQPELYKKYFPNGGGSIFTFDIKGNAEDAKKFIDSLKIFSLLANVADAKSLVIHPASTTHSQLTPKELAEQGIRENTVRLSIGLEHIDDILEDLKKALAEV
ncbi:MAG: O-acetylhomoserine aminocarboxypropyltransferase/cysteine synthase family protein [Eubacteriaceae bacterium]|nr:O-acetylhomoserine aminocarboxypropyltransferase/cysteine synthase family protein [Eubacteriaceae bacterium]